MVETCSVGEEVELQKSLYFRPTLLALLDLKYWTLSMQSLRLKLSQTKFSLLSNVNQKTVHITYRGHFWKINTMLTFKTIKSSVSFNL